MADVEKLNIDSIIARLLEGTKPAAWKNTKKKHYSFWYSDLNADTEQRKTKKKSTIIFHLMLFIRIKNLFRFISSLHQNAIKVYEFKS